MSTRGTYRIIVKKKWEDIDLCFYVHHDNYPSGAASKFKEALAKDFQQYNGKNFAKKFASIDGSEFTSSHEDHGDTEYRYDITETEKGIDVMAWEEYFEGDERKWRVFFDGLMKDFIEKFGGK